MSKNESNEIMPFKKNTIYNMNCFDFMKQVPDDYFDLIIADPNFGKTQNYWDIKTDMKEFWLNANRIVKKSAVICFAQMPFTIEVVSENMDNFKYSLVWDKVLGGNGFNCNIMPIQTHEDILVFGDSKTFYNPEKTHGHPRKTANRKASHKNNNYGDIAPIRYDSTERYPKSILKFSNGGNRKSIKHSTQKPLELMKYLLKLYAKKGFKIYIPFLGSAVDSVACKSLGLDFWATELEKEFCEIGNQRLKQVQLNLF